MLSRRDLVGKLAAGAAAVCVTGVAARRSVASVGQATSPAPGAAAAADGLDVVDVGPPATLSAPPPWELVRPLALGSDLGHGWRVAGLTGAAAGSCVLTLAKARGRTERVHLCRNDGTPQGLVHTERFDLVVMNGGQRDLPTDEGLAQAVAVLAHAVAVNESDGRHESVLSALQPHAERLERFAAAQLR